MTEENVTADTSLAARFVSALTTNDPAQLVDVLTPDVGLREYTPDHIRVLRQRDKVVRHFQDDVALAPDTQMELLSATGDGERLAVEYRVQRTLDGRYTEEYRSAFLQVRDGQIPTIDAYRTAILPSAHRGDWIAPPPSGDEDVVRLFDELRDAWDVREWIPPNADGWGSLRGGYGGSGDAHPGSNGCGGFHWPADVADEKIEEMIEHFRARNIGFTWFVSPFDQPPDLAERLERHGLILAGDQLAMARVGLNPTDIPINPDVEIVVLDGSRDDWIEADLQIVGRAFNWTKEQIDERRESWFERIKNPALRENQISYLALLDGQPVGDAALSLRGGMAYMGGAAVLPEYRNRKVYSTLLARRLRDAHERGYHIAGIHAEPMSRRVVVKYGFKPYARFLVYAWMPEPDMDVIRSLVPQD